MSTAGAFAAMIVHSGLPYTLTDTFRWHLLRMQQVAVHSMHSIHQFAGYYQLYGVM